VPQRRMCGRVQPASMRPPASIEQMPASHGLQHEPAGQRWTPRGGLFLVDLIRLLCTKCDEKTVDREQAQVLNQDRRSTQRRRGRGTLLAGRPSPIYAPHNHIQHSYAQTRPTRPATDSPQTLPVPPARLYHHGSPPLRCSREGAVGTAQAKCQSPDAMKSRIVCHTFRHPSHYPRAPAPADVESPPERR
jgi:hypothetical protein